MKTKFIAVLLTFLLVFISCGKDEKEKETDEKSDSKNFYHSQLRLDRISAIIRLNFLLLNSCLVHD